MISLPNQIGPFIWRMAKLWKAGKTWKASRKESVIAGSARKYGQAEAAQLAVQAASLFYSGLALLGNKVK